MLLTSGHGRCFKVWHDYSKKFAGVYDSVGMGEWVVDARAGLHGS